MTSRVNNDLAISHLSAEQKRHFLEQVAAEDDLKSFYNAINSEDITLVDLLVDYKGLGELPHVLDSLLSESYARLKIQNVPLSRGMEVFVESKLIDLRFFTSKEVENKKCKKVTLQDVKTRIKLICLHTEMIINKFLNKTGNVIDGEFILLLRFVAQNIRVLKRQLKGTYTRLPWEEMEFLLVCFTSALCAPREVDIIYLLVLDQARLVSHLYYFDIKLREVERELKEKDVGIKLALGNRSLIIRNILIESPNFEDLYRDHDLVKSVYSMKRIRYYIRLALNVDPNQGTEVEILVLERTLQVVGESLKNSPDSPNVSEEVHQLLVHRAPRQARELSTALRDCLSHSRSYTRRPEQDALLRQRLREDLRKLDAEIAFILYKKKKDALQIFLNKAINCRDAEELTALIHEPNNIRDEDMNFSKDFSLEFLQVARGLFQTLKEKVVDKTGVKDLFHEAEERLRSEETRKNDVQKSFTEEASYVIKLIKNFSAGGDIMEIKEMVKKCLLKLTPEDPPEKFKRFLIVVTKICVHVIERHGLDARQADVSLRIDNNMMESILYRIFAMVEFVAGRIGGIDEFRNSIEGGPEKEDEAHQKVQLIFDDVVDSLDRQQDRTALEEKFKKSKELHRAKGELITYFDSRLRGESKTFDGFDNCIKKLCLKHKNIKDLEKFYEEGDYGKCKSGVQIIEDHYGKFVRTVEDLSLFSREKYSEAFRAFFGTLKLKGKANDNFNCSIIQHIEKKNQEILDYFSSRLSILDGLLSSCSIGTFSIVHGSPHHAAVEMLVLELTEILDNMFFFGDGAQFLDQFFPVLIGKNLRNYLAHGDPLADGLFSDPRTVVTRAASLLVRAGGELVGRSDALIGENIVADFDQVQRMYDVCLGTIIHQDAMFDAIEQGNQDQVKDCLSTGVDVKGADFKGWTGLHYAAAVGNTQILQFFLEHGVNINATDIYGKTPAEIACYYGRMIVLQHLVERNYLTTDYVTPDQNTLLHLAAKFGRADVVSGLLNGGNVNFENVFGQTPLHLASEGGHAAVVRLLLEAGAAQTPTTCLVIPLFLAARAGHGNVVRLLLAEGASAYVKGDGTTEQDEEAGKLLHIAALNGHREVVKILLSHVDDNTMMDFIHSPSRNGSRALHLAAEKGHAGVVEELLARGSSVEKEDKDGQTALHVAAANGFTSVIKLLLNEGTAIDAADKHLRTSLHLAVKRGHAEAAQELLDRGSDVRVETQEGYTALHIAAGNDNTKILQILLDSGARIETFSHDGCTALHVAALHSLSKAVKCLINHAKKLNRCREFVNSSDINNSTALHVVAAMGDEECAKELLGAGAAKEARDDAHRTALHVAAQHGNVDIIRLLIENGCDINAVTPNNGSALLFAVQNDRSQAVLLLIEKGIKIDTVTMNNETALLIAASRGNKNMVQALLCAVKKDDIKAFINAPQKDSQQTALHFAVKNGYKEITSLLLDAGANVEATDKDANTPMIFAAVTGNMDVFMALLDKNANINVVNKYGSPLSYAAAGGHLPLVKKLLALGSDPHQVDPLGQTALHWAARNGHKQVVEFLLNFGLDIEAIENDGFTALHLAANNGHHDVAELLLKNKASINKRTIKGDFTPLHCASQLGHLKVVKLLIDYGADVARNSTALHLAATNESIVEALLRAGAEVDASDVLQSSALHWAARGGQTEVVSLLLDYGADPELRDGQGQTPLFLATQCDRGSVVKYLVNRKVNVNAVDPFNITALHATVMKGNREITQFLLDNGANVNCATKSGSTPLHISALKGYHDLVSILITKGANVGAMDDSNRTALHHAVINGNLMVVEELVKFGALDRESADGLAALKLAVHCGHEEVFDFLRNCWTLSRREEV